MLQHSAALNPFDSFPLHSKQEMSLAIPVGPRMHVAGCGLAKAVNNRRRADSNDSNNDDDEPLPPFSPQSEEESMATSFEDSVPTPPVAVASRSRSASNETRRDPSVSRRVSILHALRTNPSLLPARRESRPEKSETKTVDEEGPRCRVAIRAPYGSPNHFESSPIDSCEKPVSESYTDSPRRLRPPTSSPRHGSTTVVDNTMPQQNTAIHIAWHNTGSTETEKSARPAHYRSCQRC